MIPQKPSTPMLTLIAPLLLLTGCSTSAAVTFVTEGVPLKVKADSQLTVVTRDGECVDGRVLSTAENVLTIETDEERSQSFAFRDIEQLEQQTFDVEKTATAAVLAVGSFGLGRPLSPDQPTQPGVVVKCTE